MSWHQSALTPSPNANLKVKGPLEELSTPISEGPMNVSERGTIRGDTELKIALGFCKL